MPPARSDNPRLDALLRKAHELHPTEIDLTLGRLERLLGALGNWVRMQDEAECIFSVVDLHAITVAQDPATLRRGIHEMVAALIAAGLDPERCILFPQSRVRVHAELAWVLMCTARVCWLNRMTQFKEKSGKDREGASVGLYTYPVLQAADVLLYQATHVPVGEDQKQHLELARDIAQKFNNDFASDDAPVFTLPEPIIPAEAARIMSLRDGNAKMSKSTSTGRELLPSLMKAKDTDLSVPWKPRKAFSPT